MRDKNFTHMYFSQRGQGFPISGLLYDVAKDLGVFWDSHMTMVNQIVKVCKKHLHCIFEIS